MKSDSEISDENFVQKYTLINENENSCESESDLSSDKNQIQDENEIQFEEPNKDRKPGINLFHCWA